MRSVLALASLLCASCAGTQYSQVNTPKGSVYVGMSNDQIAHLLGPPDMVADGYACRYSNEFFGWSPGTATIEWAWLWDDSTLVAYMEQGRVRMLGTVPRSRPTSKPAPASASRPTNG